MTEDALGLNLARKYLLIALSKGRPRDNTDGRASRVGDGAYDDTTDACDEPPSDSLTSPTDEVDDIFEQFDEA